MTAINGLFVVSAKVFPKLNPTERHTIRPGPAVEAIASISLIFLDILSTAVFNPAKDKLHPPLFIIGFGNLNFSGFPYSAKTSISRPPGNSISKSFAVLSNASPKASSIVVPNRLYLPIDCTLKY